MIILSPRQRCVSHARWPRLLLLLVAITFLLPGCSRSLREDAKQIAQVGTTTSDQIVDFYEAAQKDVQDELELNLLNGAYDRELNYQASLKERATALARPTPGQTPPPEPAKPPIELQTEELEDIKIAKETRAYLATRIRLAKAMGKVYSSYIALAEFNAPGEMESSVQGLIGAVKTASGTALPAPATTGATTAIAAAFGDLLKQVEVAHQNRKLIAQGKNLVPLLAAYKKLFTEERKLISGGDFPTKDANGKEVLVHVDGISQERVLAYKTFYQALVTGDAVISKPLLNKYLEGAGMTWAYPEKPFTDKETPAIKAMVIRKLELNAEERLLVTNDLGVNLEGSFDKLIKLHTELEHKQRLSLEEAYKQSATVQFLVEELKKKDVPVDFIEELAKALAKEEKGAKP